MQRICYTSRDPSVRTRRCYSLEANRFIDLSTPRPTPLPFNSKNTNISSINSNDYVESSRSAKIYLNTNTKTYTPISNYINTYNPSYVPPKQTGGSENLKENNPSHHHPEYLFLAKSRTMRIFPFLPPMRK